MDAPRPPNVKRWLLLAAEVALVLAILALLAAIWMPAIIGARPGTPTR